MAQFDHKKFNNGCRLLNIINGKFLKLEDAETENFICGKI